MTGREWIDAYAAALGVEAPDEATVEALLDLAGVAAHAVGAHRGTDHVLADRPGRHRGRGGPPRSRRPRRAEAVTIRVAQWATGGVGAIALAAMARRSDLELVGVVVHDPAKVGRDAGDLCGLGPLGVTATDDADAVLGLVPEAVCYAASGEARPGEAVDDLVRLLRAGVNVVTHLGPRAGAPRGVRPRLTDRLEAACAEGGTSLYVSGIEPGFAADHLVLLLSTLTRTITSVRTQELFSYAAYPVTFTMFDVFGFGRPPEDTCLMELPGVQASAWAPPVRMVADHLGAELDEIRETYEKVVTDRRLEVAAA